MQRNEKLKISGAQSITKGKRKRTLDVLGCICLYMWRYWSRTEKFLFVVRLLTGVVQWWLCSVVKPRLFLFWRKEDLCHEWTLMDTLSPSYTASIVLRLHFACYVSQRVIETTGILAPVFHGLEMGLRPGGCPRNKPKKKEAAHSYANFQNPADLRPENRSKPVK